jgi:large subunit ribosomal protein L7A
MVECISAVNEVCDLEGSKVSLETLKNDTNHLVGTKQTLKAIRSDKAEKVYVAKNAASYVIDPIIKECAERNIEVIYVDDMHELGNACKIQVKAATVAVLKK